MEQLTTDFLVEAIDKIQQLEFERSDHRNTIAELTKECTAPITATVEEWNAHCAKTNAIVGQIDEYNKKITDIDFELTQLKNPIISKLPRGTWFKILTYMGERWIGLNRMNDVIIKDVEPQLRPNSY